MNITEMRELHIEKVYRPLIGKTMKPSEAKEANNAFGKVIGSAKVQVEAVALSKDKPADIRKEIPFLK